MTYNPLPAPSLSPNDDFNTIIDRLKRQDILPQEAFLQNIPFFNLTALPKELQIKQFFQGSYDSKLYNFVLKKMLSSTQDTNEDFSKQSSEANMMTFAQVCLYKVFACPNAACANYPREIVTHNQYKDYEFECPFYHHDRDRRRLCIALNGNEEFEYKANYYEEGRSNVDREKYSQNYFESMFHPLYYKMFRCKRDYCNASVFCPFFHHEEEKKIWDKVFNSFIKKDRITYVKDKKKYYESTSHAAEAQEPKSSAYESPTKLSQNTKQQNSNRNKKKANQKNLNNLNQNQNYYRQIYNDEGRVGNTYQASGKKGKEARKDSSDSFGSNNEPAGIFNSTKQIPLYRAC